jgi:thioredoxin reductase (NADPH)
MRPPNPQPPDVDDVADCLIIGGGPAGLTAAIYLARFHLRTALIDAGASRAALIPCTRNHAGFPDGIAGSDLLDRMRRQALIAGAEIHSGKVDLISRTGSDFAAEADRGAYRARMVLLATGVSNRGPKMPPALQAAALASGRLRYCPVCDGFEVTDQLVAVIGSGARGVKEALFLRSYTDSVTLIADEPSHQLSAMQRSDLIAGGIEILDGPATDFQLETEGLSVATASGRRVFASIYPALGSDVHSDLGRAIGAEVTDEGCLKVDAHQRTSVAGLYAAGDVVIGLDQISHAMGEAGVAATTIRNDLAMRAPLRR